MKVLHIAVFLSRWEILSPQSMGIPKLHKRLQPEDVQGNIYEILLHYLRWWVLTPLYRPCLFRAFACSFSYKQNGQSSKSSALVSNHLCSAATLGGEKLLHQHRPQTAFLISLTILTSNHVPCQKFSRKHNGDKPPNYGGFGSLCQGIRRGTKGAKGRQASKSGDGTGSSRRDTKGRQASNSWWNWIQ